MPLKFQYRSAWMALSFMPVLAACDNTPPPPTAEQIAARGRYLVTLGGCNDCHTPGSMTGMPDMSKPLSGSDISFFLPGMGYFYPPNLTPDASGLWDWSPAQIVTALRTGVRPDGRQLAPIMPWMSLASLTDEDANAIPSPPIRCRRDPPWESSRRMIYGSLAHRHHRPRRHHHRPADARPPASGRFPRSNHEDMLHSEPDKNRPWVALVIGRTP
jgi:mono/diheme cytochrome c family protein